jgi:hypothetical protein
MPRRAVGIGFERTRLEFQVAEQGDAQAVALDDPRRVRFGGIVPPPKYGSPAFFISPSCSANAALPKSPEWLLASDIASKWRASSGSTAGSARKV